MNRILFSPLGLKVTSRVLDVLNVLALMVLGAEVIAVAGANLAASGRIKTLPAAAGTYYVIGKSVTPATVAATAGAQALIRLVEPRKIIVA